MLPVTPLHQKILEKRYCENIAIFNFPPQNCRKCENRDIFAISFERSRTFKFGFEHSKAHVIVL
jgi:hypothetical protein